MQPNVLMCRYVCELLPPTNQTHLRSAGSVGCIIFEELVALGDVPVYVEVLTDGDTPMNAPIRGVDKPKTKVPSQHVVVFCERALRRFKMKPNWSRLPWSSIRYHCDPQHPRGKCLPNSLMSGSCAAHIELVCEGVEGMSTTPSGYLSKCAKLQQADLSCFKNVTVIDDSFMDKTGVRVDLSPLTNVHTIKDNMLMHNLLSIPIDFAPLGNVTSIGNDFMSHSYKLTSIDLSPFVNLKSIGTSFMNSCESLLSIDLTPLSKSLISIEGGFLARCLAMTHVDLTPLKGVTSIGYGILSACYGLVSVTLPTFDNSTAIGTNFMGDCLGLRSIDLSPLHNMTTIPPHFLNRCTGLTSIDLTPLGGVARISRLGMTHGIPAPEGHFLAGCTGITHLDMSPLVLLSQAAKEQAVGNDFDGKITWAV